MDIVSDHHSMWAHTVCIYIYIYIYNCFSLAPDAELSSPARHPREHYRYLFAPPSRELDATVGGY